jgi:hypothetical protein
VLCLHLISVRRLPVQCRCPWPPYNALCGRRRVFCDEEEDELPEIVAERQAAGDGNAAEETKSEDGTYGG